MKINSSRFSDARGINRLPYNLSHSQSIYNFTLNRIDEIPDFNIKAYNLTHNTHGSSYIHFDSSDRNNAFCMIFKTIPTNRTGIPHILEHLALCGSEKFPVRDPFMKMISRSLNTYMNA